MIAESEEVCVEDLIDEIAMGPFGSNIKTDCFVNSGIPVFNGSNLTGFETNDTALCHSRKSKFPGQRIGLAWRYRNNTPWNVGPSRDGPL